MRRSGGWAAVAACMALAAVARPAAAQAPGDDDARACEPFRNLLAVSIPTEQRAVPCLLALLSDAAREPHEVAALRGRCTALLAAAPPLVDWAGTAPGLRPTVDMEGVARDADAKRRELDRRYPGTGR